MTGLTGRDAVIVAAVRTPIGKGKPGGRARVLLPCSEWMRADDAVR